MLAFLCCHTKCAAAATVPYTSRSSEQLLIQWCANGRTKWVKRLNLILQGEDRAAFRFRLLQAQRRRDEVSSRRTVLAALLCFRLSSHGSVAQHCSLSSCTPGLTIILCAQMEREARYNHYVSSLQFHNLSKLDGMFRQRVMYMVGHRLVELQPDVATGELTHRTGQQPSCIPTEVQVCSTEQPTLGPCTVMHCLPCGRHICRTQISDNNLQAFLVRCCDTLLGTCLQNSWKLRRNTTRLQ